MLSTPSTLRVSDRPQHSDFPLSSDPRMLDSAWGIREHLVHGCVEPGGVMEDGPQELVVIQLAHRGFLGAGGLPGTSRERTHAQGAPTGSLLSCPEQPAPGPVHVTSWGLGLSRRLGKRLALLLQGRRLLAFVNVTQHLVVHALGSRLVLRVMEPGPQESVMVVLAHLSYLPAVYETPIVPT